MRNPEHEKNIEGMVKLYQDYFNEFASSCFGDDTDITYEITADMLLSEERFDVECTTHSVTDAELQAYINFKELQVVKEYNGVPFKTIKADSLSELYDKGLPDLSFNQSTFVEEPTSEELFIVLDKLCGNNILGTLDKEYNFNESEKTVDFMFDSANHEFLYAFVQCKADSPAGIGEYTYNELENLSETLALSDFSNVEGTRFEKPVDCVDIYCQYDLQANIREAEVVATYPNGEKDYITLSADKGEIPEILTNIFDKAIEQRSGKTVSAITAEFRKEIDDIQK